MKDICIYVANHRESEPLNDAPYRLLRVGSNNAEVAACQSDDVSFDCLGGSIAFKNFAYSELTGIYWIWKNAHNDIVGLMHYRRYLAAPGTDRPLNAEEIEKALGEHEFLVPKPIELNCSVSEHYAFCHPVRDLMALTKVMEGQSEAYKIAFSEIMQSNLLVPCNIFVAEKDMFDAYCSWLFGVLEECEKHIDIYSGRDDYQRRVFGFMSERLLLVWLVANDVDCGFYEVLNLDSAEDLRKAALTKSTTNILSGIDGLKKSQLFEEDFYFDTYEDVAQAYPRGKGMMHYFDYGMKEHRMPSSAYMMDDYINMRPKLRESVGEYSPKLFDSLRREVGRKKVCLSRHLVLGLAREGLIDYSPVYDWMYYSSRYDDVPGDYFHTKAALEHFIEIGMPEGRQGSKGFSLNAYKGKHPDLVERFGDDNRRYYMHYMRGEGRKRLPIRWDYAE